MNEHDRLNIRLIQQRDLNRKRLGLNWDVAQKYRLDKFELTPGNKDAFLMACDFIHITHEAKMPDEVCKDQIEVEVWYEQHNYTHHFLTLSGDCGRGKTHLALGIAIVAIDGYGYSTVYYQVPDLLGRLRASLGDNPGDSYQHIMNRCKNCDLLILDDLGMQKNTDWALEQLDSIIDCRYVDDELQTVFTTNLTPEQLPPRIASRLSEGETATLTGPDYRKLIAKQRGEKRHLVGEAEAIISNKRKNNDE